MENLIKRATDKRLEQIFKILDYAEGYLNVDVQFIDHKQMGSDAGGYIAPEGKERGKITLSDGYPSLMTIFILLHEIGHHIDFLKRGIVQEEEDAYLYYPEKRGQSCPKQYRKLITYTEDQAIKYSYELAVMLDLKLPAFQFLKDELYTKRSLDMVLSNGPMTREEIRELKRKCHKEAKRLLKTKYNNRKVLPLPGKV